MVGPIRLLKERLINHLSTYKFKIQGCMAHGRSWLTTSVTAAMMITYTYTEGCSMYNCKSKTTILRILGYTTDVMVEQFTNCGHAA